MKPKTIYTFIGVYLLTLMWSPPSSAGMSSPSFWVPTQVLDSGGSQSSSEGFRHLGAIGQSTPIGFSKSKSFFNQPGFIPQLIFHLPSGECVEDDSGTLDIAGVKGAVGENVQILIRTQNVSNKINSFGFEVIYDSAVLKYSGFEPGGLVKSFNPFYVNLDIDRPGKLIIGGSSTEGGIPQGTSGDLVYLEFTVKRGNECYPLHMEKLKDDIVDFSSSRGCFCIRNCNEDLNEDGDITPSDALAAFKCYLKTGPCSDCADVNKDGDVTPKDAFCVFQKYLGHSSCLESVTK